MEPNNNLIGTADVARMLGKSHRTVHRMVESGELVPVLTAPGGFNGAFLFALEDVEALLSSTPEAS